MSSTLVETIAPSTIDVDGVIHNTRVLIESNAIQARVTEMGFEIANSYAVDEEVLVLCVMNGAKPFATDLQAAMQQARSDLKIDSSSIKVSSYEGARSTNQIRLDIPLTVDITGKNVLVAEDIFDSGQTLLWLIDYLKKKDPGTLAVAVAINKANPDRPEGMLGDTKQYYGFLVPNGFIIGYGLDYKQQYRDLPSVHSLRPEITDL
ncbi:MAG: phosphoribosyltransferase family protein [Candidatus Saccharimonadales bacterium]